MSRNASSSAPRTAYTVVLKQTCPYLSKEASKIILAKLDNSNVKATSFIDIGTFHAFVIEGQVQTSLDEIIKSQWVAFIEPETEIHASKYKVHQVESARIASYAAKDSGLFVGPLKNPHAGPGSVHTKILVQKNAPWNLSRICRRDTFSLTSDYIFSSYGCADVDAYVLDTGIDVQHPQFEGRATFVANFSGEASSDDVSGHGSHVAGIIGAQIYGVCKHIQIKAIKIMSGNDSGTSRAVLLGLDWIAKNRNLARKTIVNLSFSGPWSPSINEAINQLSKLNVVIVAAAGNNDADACNYSPSGATGVLTVGASIQTDAICTDPPSNYGSCVNLYAPGYQIPSVHMGGGIAVMSGTSMAAAHGTGGIASFWSGTSLTANQVIQLLMGDGTSIMVWGMKQGANPRSILLYVQY